VSETEGVNPIPERQQPTPRKPSRFRPGVPAKQFLKDLWREIENDNVSNGAAALAYFWMLAVFPAAIALLSILPYLPIPNLQQAIMNMLGQAMPGEAANLFKSTIEGVVNNRSSSLLSFGFLATLWSGASGIYSVMQQLNITYDVKEQRPFWKARGMSVFLLFLFGALIVAAFTLVVFGGSLQDLLASRLGEHEWLLAGFAVFRWAIVLGLLLFGFAVMYYFGPDVQQTFKFITPGSVAGTVIIILAALGFRFYVGHFASYNATYGSLGAVIILLFWLYITGMVLLLGSEVNALYEHYRADGKDKGEKRLPPS